MNEFKKYRRKQIAELRPVTQHEIDNPDAILDNGISVSQVDLENGSPKIGDMIARNPKNHSDQWLVANLNNVSEKDFSWRRLTKRSRIMGYEIKKTICPRFGYRNNYHINVFRAEYPQYSLTRDKQLL